MITLLLVLVVIGVVLYLFNTLVTMDAKIKTAINVIVCLIAFLYVLGALTGRSFGKLTG